MTEMADVPVTHAARDQGKDRAPAPNSLRAWVLATRPPTLAAALVPVGVGTAIASATGSVSMGPAFAALAGALVIQVGSNFVNDAYDFERGADQHDRVGPRRAAASGLLTPRQLRRGTALLFACALLLGVYLSLASSPWVFVIGIVSMVFAVAYTAGPFPLAYHGLGDVFVFVFFGPIAVAGTTFVQTRSVQPAALLGGMIVGALATNLLVVNNLRDMATDARADKKTLAVRFGRSFCLLQYAGSLLLAYGLLLPFAGMLDRRGALLPYVTAPLGIWLWRELARHAGEALNPVLKATAKLLFLFGGLLALGLLLP